MGMADPREFGIGKLKKDSIYDISLFTELDIAIDRDVRRQKFACSIIVSAGYNNLGIVTSVKVDPLVEGVAVGGPVSNRSILLESSSLMSIAKELEFNNIKTLDRSESAKRISDLKERITFLENVLYGVLQVDPAKVEGLRKIRE
jgi:hypothetical protein